MTSRIAKVDGLVVESTGPESGLPVLFGHSLLFHRRMYDAQVAELSRDFRCITLDFRGHGESAMPPRGFHMTDQAEDYRKVMDHFGIARAAVVGLSMGGMAAMHLAVAHPSRVAGLVLLNTSADPEPAVARAKDMALAVMARMFGVNAFILRQVAPLMFGETFRAASPDVVEGWMQQLTKLDRTALYRAVTMVMSRPAVPRLGDIRAPTFVLAGDEDAAIPVDRMERIAAAIPNAELRILPRTGHISTVEQPELTTKLLRAWLQAIADA